MRSELGINETDSNYRIQEGKNLVLAHGKPGKYLHMGKTPYNDVQSIFYYCDLPSLFFGRVTVTAVLSVVATTEN